VLILPVETEIDLKLINFLLGGRGICEGKMN
jgi:hypothetical protein